MAVSEDKFKIYYSGANENEQIQTSSHKSLGGYRSSVIVPNSRLSNVFDEVGIYDLMIGHNVCRCLYIRNEHSADSINNLTLYITGKKDFEKIKIGVSLPTAVDGQVQLLDNQDSIPYNVEFYEAYAVDDKLTLISELKKGEMLALWLLKETTNTELRNLDGELTFHFEWS